RGGRRLQLAAKRWKNAFVVDVRSLHRQGAPSIDRILRSQCPRLQVLWVERRLPSDNRKLEYDERRRAVRHSPCPEAGAEQRREQPLQIGADALGVGTRPRCADATPKKEYPHLRPPQGVVPSCSLDAPGVSPIVEIERQVRGVVAVIVICGREGGPQSAVHGSLWSEISLCILAPPSPWTRSELCQTPVPQGELETPQGLSPAGLFGRRLR